MLRRKIKTNRCQKILNSEKSSAYLVNDYWLEELTELTKLSLLIVGKMDFLAENNYCGQTLLKLVSRGNSTIAELLRLKDVIPSIYKDPSVQEKFKYGELLSLDLSYFSGSNDENVSFI